MFVIFQKYQFVYRNKVNSPPIRQFPSRDHNLNVKAQENLKIYFWGKVHFVVDIANHLYSQNTPLTQALNPLRSVNWSNLWISKAYLNEEYVKIEREIAKNSNF